MKKTLIAFAALSAIAGMAQAQSTVTLYGLLDANINSFKTNSFETGTGKATSLSQTNIGSGGLSGSRFGFRITEDLGGGLSAIGNLEGGLSIDTGMSGQGALFGRQANVGVASTSLGTVTIGRNKSPYYDLTASTHLQQSVFDPSSYPNNTIGNIGAATGVISPAGAVTAAQYLLANHGGQANINSSTALGFNARIDNSIRYTSPNFSGFSASLLYGFGENKTATTSASRTTGATAQYSNGPVLAYLGYQSDALATVAASGSKPALENTLVGASYDFGVAKVGASYNRAKLKDITVGGAGISPQKEYALSVAVPLGATTLQAGYAQSKGDTLGKSTGFGVQALYALSKRTTLYTGYSTLKAYDNLASAYVLATPGSSIERSKLFAAGVRHTF